ncbi:MAG: phosphotransferase [Pseudomonadota bacterium]
MSAVQPPAHLWGMAAALEPLSGGNRSSVYRTCGPAPPLVFKSTTRGEDALRWLLPVLDRARLAGFRVPEMLISRAGTYSADGWTCESFLPGQPASDADLRALAPMLAGFHTHARLLPQRPGFLSSEMLLRENWGGDVNLARMPVELVAMCRDAWAALLYDEPETAALETIIHGDLCPENVLMQPGQPPALIDWDEARRDRAAFDHVYLGHGSAVLRQAHLAWEVACSWTREPTYARRMAARLQALSSGDA